MTSSLYENQDITNLDKRVIKLTSVNETKKRLFDRGKVKLQTNRFNETITINFDSLVIGSIGTEKNNNKTYTELIFNSFGLKNEDKEYFMKNSTNHTKEVQLLCGLRSLDRLLQPICAEQLDMSSLVPPKYRFL